MSLAQQLCVKPRDGSVQHKAPNFHSRDKPIKNDEVVEQPQETLPMDEEDDPISSDEQPEECSDDEDTEQIIHDAAAERTDAYLREFGESIIVLATNRFLVKREKEAKKAESSKKQEKMKATPSPVPSKKRKLSSK